MYTGVAALAVIPALLYGRDNGYVSGSKTEARIMDILQHGTLDVPDQPEVIYILKKLKVYFTQDDKDDWVADVWDGIFHAHSDRGETKDDARREAVAWVYENFNVPKSIEIMGLEYHQPEELYERKDIR